MQWEKYFRTEDWIGKNKRATYNALGEISDDKEGHLIKEIGKEIKRVQENGKYRR